MVLWIPQIKKRICYDFSTVMTALGKSCRISVLGLIVLACCTALSAQEEGPGRSSAPPGRRQLTGTLAASQPTKTFSLNLEPGLYRLAYFSKTAPAVLQVISGGTVMATSGPTRPFTTIMKIVNGRLQKTLDLAPTGLCTSDITLAGDCALEKLHFELTKAATVSVKISGKPQSVAAFKLFFDPLQKPPSPETIAIGTLSTNYLSYTDNSSHEPPAASFKLPVTRGQRVGVLFGSPDFSGTLEVRNSSGNLVASNSGFNEFFDPCAKVRIDRLPPFDPLSQAASYLTIDPSEEDLTYTISVRARNAGETGLYILRTFNLPDLSIAPQQMRSGTFGPRPASFSLALLPYWRSLGPQISAYSLVPVSVTLRDKTGHELAVSEAHNPQSFQQGVQANQLSMMYSATLDISGFDDATLSDSHVEVRGGEGSTGQFYLVGLAAPWGACGGGAVDPIAVIFPNPSDFKDVGFALPDAKHTLSEFEALLYTAARRNLNWYFLLQATNGEKRDPTELVSNYVRFVPAHASLTALLVDYQLAVRAQFSPSTGTTKIWTRVERRGFKEKQWTLDLTETAKSQQLLVESFKQSAGQR